MKITAMAAGLLVAGVAGCAHSQRNGASAAVTVYVERELALPQLTMMQQRAQDIAARMFAQAGVRIEWRAGRHANSEFGLPIVVEITSNTPEGFHRGALAYALEFEGTHIRIFYDRIESSGCGSATTMLLAHVLVHEITHLLEGVDRHSDTGVMKAHWDNRDIDRMAYQPLRFAPADLDLIRRGMARRPGIALN